MKAHGHLYCAFLYLYCYGGFLTVNRRKRFEYDDGTAWRYATWSWAILFSNFFLFFSIIYPISFIRTFFPFLLAYLCFPLNWSDLIRFDLFFLYTFIFIYINCIRWSFVGVYWYIIWGGWWWNMCVEKNLIIMIVLRCIYKTW